MRAVELPEFIAGKDIIISSSYRKNLREVREASLKFSSLGLRPYPTHNQEEIILDSGFVFLGGVQQQYKKREIQKGFFRAIKKSRLLYVVTSNGYLGETASIETTYGLANGVPTFLSEPITEFGTDVPPEIIRILKIHEIPVLPIENIENFGKDGTFKNGDLPKPAAFNDQQRRDLFFAIASTMRSLR